MSFSILVSELTPELLGKAEYWRLYLSDFVNAAKSTYWAEVAHHTELHCAPDGGVYIGPEDLGDYVAGAHMCFPVSISTDGTEVRLECPRMPDEPLIAEWSDTTETTATLHGMTSTVDDRLRWRLEVSGIALTYWTLPPTPEHYPRRTCDGVWVWSTRR